MQTRKLYYEDCHCRDFSATVISCRQVQGGFEILLDATAFYPEGGGQACDTGSLGGVQVLQVCEKDGNILHLCDGPLPQGAAVQGSILWERRFDLMQQHTGEHILSGIIHKKYGWHNTGFHVGADTVTVDFDGAIPQDDLAKLETLANEAVFSDLPVACFVPSEEALPGVFYRTKRALPWPVRIVQVPGYDSCACCGVHVERTGEIGMIKLLSIVKFHQGVRMEMVCGKRALGYFQELFRQNRMVSQAFSAKPLETGLAAQKINALLAEEKQRAGQLEKQLLDGIAKGYEGKKNAVHFADFLSPVGARELANKISHCTGGIAAVFAPRPEGGFSLCMVSSSQDVKALGAEAVRVLGGKGGGKPDAFSGTVSASKDEILAFFRSKWE